MDRTLDADCAPDARRLTGSTKQEAGANRPGLGATMAHSQGPVGPAGLKRKQPPLNLDFFKVVGHAGVPEHVLPRTMVDRLVNYIRDGRWPRGPVHIKALRRCPFGQP